MSEEYIMENQEKTLNNVSVVAYNSIPYFILDDELEKTGRESFTAESKEIIDYYTKYQQGMEFIPEGSNGDYIPSVTRFRKAAKIINKEARFLFANPATFNVNIDDVNNEYKDENVILQTFLEKVLKKNNIDGKLLKAAKDCLIGKRVGIILNFNDNGISIEMLKSTEFVFESSAKGVDHLTKFVAFYNLNDSTNKIDQRWFKKVYSLENDVTYVEEKIYDGMGVELEIVTPKRVTKFNRIPAAVILNDGLTGDIKGTSELSTLLDFESLYSKMANADVDAQRKSMNPIRYTIDASQGSTSNLSSAAGSYWDLQSDEDKAETRQAKAGILESSMNYSESLNRTLDRIENEMYSQVDVPNINSEKLQGVITSGKTLKALYWDLTVRCDEKMLAWKFALEYICDCIIEGGKLYPNSISKYINTSVLPDIPTELTITNNYPLPEDEAEEKQIDITEVSANVMSRKSYLKKWRNLNDEEADEEIRQIKMEIDMFENSQLNDTINQTNEDMLDDEFDYGDMNE